MQMRQVVPAFMALVVSMAGAPGESRSQEVITLTEAGDPTVYQVRGQIIRWDANELVWVASGREQRVAAHRVSSVEFARQPAHDEGDQLLALGRFDQAAARYEEALGQENRNWVIEEIRARRLRCAAATGDVSRAVREFMALLQIQAESRFYYLAPLAWQPTDRPAGDLVAEMPRWLEGDDPVLALFAASWLFTQDEEAALRRLRQLATGSDRRIAWLAEAQCWRAQLLTATASELERWETTLARMPEPWQAGPRFLVAVVKIRIQGDSDAVVAAMQIPILFPEQYQLCGGALRLAHDGLTRLGRNGEAELVAAELVRSYGLSTAAARFQGASQSIDPQP
jgi:hypothetical protein